jgi:putative Mg2+ transporter-C (MgtC) family protein
MDVTPYEQLEALLTLLVAATLGAVLGLNREWSRRPAGLRTHMLVAVGAALVMVLSRLQFSPDTVGRMATGVLTGIGFLGGGVIIHRQSQVQGLTTAASIWLVAVIGLTAGAQLYVLAVGATVISWFVLAVLLRVSRAIDPRQTAEDEEID